MGEAVRIHDGTAIALEAAGTWCGSIEQEGLQNVPLPPGQERRQHTLGLHELVENFLEKVFDVGFVGDALADEVAQAGLFVPHDFGDFPVLLDHRSHAHCRSIHS